jgi:hypothetical protein
MSAWLRRMTVSASRASLGSVRCALLSDTITVVCRRYGTMCCMNHTSVCSVATGVWALGAAQPAARSAPTTNHPSRCRTVPPTTERTLGVAQFVRLPVP